MRRQLSINLAIALVGMVAVAMAPPSWGDDKALIDANTVRALTWLRASSDDTADLLERAAGVLVFPDVVEMGFGVGGQFGEGALLVGGETVDYYATAGKTFGLGPEAEYKAEVILFMSQEALQSFRATRSFKVGEHATVPMLAETPGAARVGVIFSEDGLVPNLGLDGNRITRIVR